ncbi:hypothetical protein KG007_01915 [Alistipes sp. kh20]|nr:hypothetical protein [Alistipes montrealensis]
MKKSNLIILISIFFLNFSCGKISKYEIVNLIEDISIDNYNDSLFFSDVLDMNIDNDSLYILENHHGTIIVSDLNLKYLKTIGRSGKAYNEFLFPSSFVINNDTIVIKDSGKERFLMYNKFGHAIHTLPYSKCPIGVSDKFAYCNNSIIDCSRDSLFAILYMDNRKGYFIQKGAQKEYGSILQTMHRNSYFNFNYKNKIISVSNNDPTISVYNRNLEKVNELNYSYIDFVGRQFKYAEEKINKEKSFFIMVKDVYIYDNYIYILLAEKNNNVKYTVNKVAVFSFINSDIVFCNILQLPGSLYSSICIYDNILFAVDLKKSSIGRYYMGPKNSGDI